MPPTDAHSAPHRQRGFTLLEVMVAIAVLAIALASVIKVASESGANLSYLRDKTLALWVAENKLAEMQATELWLEGRQKGKTALGGRDWFWEVESLGDPFPNMRRVVIRVTDREGGDSWLTSLNGFLANPELRQGVPGGGSGNGQ